MALVAGVPLLGPVYSTHLVMHELLVACAVQVAHLASLPATACLQYRGRTAKELNSVDQEQKRARGRGAKFSVFEVWSR